MRNQLNGHKFERVTAKDINPGDTICYANSIIEITRIEQRPTSEGPAFVLHYDGGRPITLLGHERAYRILDDQPEPEDPPEVAAEPERGPGRPEVGPATNLRLGPDRTARIDAIRQHGDSRAATIRRLLDGALDDLDMAAPPYSTAYGLGLAAGARIALNIIDRGGPEQVAAFARGDRRFPADDLSEGRPYTYMDLARDCGRQITQEDVDDRWDDWMTRIANAYSQGHIEGQRNIIEATYRAHAARIVPIKEPTMATTYYVMNSTGGEEPGSGPAWIVVDSDDSVLASAPYEDDDEITDGVRRLIAAGALPAGAEVAEETRIYSPYSWQIDPYRWTITGTVERA